MEEPDIYLPRHYHCLEMNIHPHDSHCILKNDRIIEFQTYDKQTDILSIFSIQILCFRCANVATARSKGSLQTENRKEKDTVNTRCGENSYHVST